MAAKRVFIAVTSDNRPYLFDAPNVLSLPSGTEFRFRYQKKWVDPVLLAMLEKPGHKLDGLKDARVVLVFHSQQSGELLAMREATIVRLEGLGPVVYARFKVGGFLRPPVDAISTPELAREGSTNRCRHLLELKPTVDLKERLPGGHYFRLAPEHAEVPPSGEGSAEAWWSVVSLFRGLSQVEHLPFFHVLGLSSENGKRRGWSRLSQGGRYRLRVLEWSFKTENKPLALVNCSCSPEVLILEAASNVVVGQYDVVDFDFVATKLGKGQLAIALIGVGEGKKPTPDEWSQSFHTAIPIRVMPSWWRTLLRFSLAVGGAILYVWVGPGPVKQWKPEAAYAIQVIGLLLFVVGLGRLGEQAVTAGKDVREFAKQPNA